MLPLMNIKRLVAVFQPRSIEGNLAEDEQFINELVAALKMRGTRPLDPITVWWSGMNFYVIDGHHRLEAYKRCGDTWLFDNLIPVTEFKGTLNEAIKYSIGANSKNRLPMRKVDRLNSAWKLTCLGDQSKAEIAEITGISERQVAYMRQTLREIRQDTWFVNKNIEELAGWTWQQAQMAVRGGGESDLEKDWDSETQKQAEVFKKRLLKTFGNQISMKAEAFALAIASINDSLPKRLMETYAWSAYRSDDVSDDEEHDLDNEDADDPAEEAAEF